jgi:hypothetical protein
MAISLDRLYNFNSTSSGNASFGLTGNGAQQTIIHGLTGIPDTIMVIVQDSSTASYTLAATPADATNIYVTVTNGKKYQVLAWVSAG